MGSFRMRNIKCGLYLFAPDIGKAPVKSDMKNIFESEVKNSTSERSEKRLNGLAAMVSLLRSSHQNFVYRSFVKNAARSPDEEIGVFDVLDIGGQFHDVRSIGIKALPVFQLQQPAISPRLSVLRTSRSSMAIDRS